MKITKAELIKPYTSKYEEIVEFLRNPTRDAARAAACDAARNANAACADRVEELLKGLFA